MTEAKKSLRNQQLQLREDAILDAVNRLLGEKGYDLMTMDDVAEAVGVAKGSIYKHFDSKEALAAAVMIRLIKNTVGYIEALPAAAAAISKLKQSLRWALETRLHGGLPYLPSNSPTLRNSLLANMTYLGQVFRMNTLFSALIEQAKRDGHLKTTIPSEIIMYTLYARSCDPTLDYLRLAGGHKDNDIIARMIDICFDGMGA